MTSVQCTNQPLGQPKVSGFLVAFAAVTMVAVALATAPVYFGASPDYLTVLTPVFQWIPFVTIATLWALGRAQTAAGASRRRGGGGLWAASGARIKGRFGAIARTSLLALCCLLLVCLTPILLAGALGFVDLRWAPGAAVAAALTLPVALVFMIPVAGEELAWRGYLATLLSPKGFASATAVIAALWAAWHLPLTIALAHAGELAARDVASKTVDILLASVMLSALRYLSDSVWPAVFAHVLFNNLYQMAQYNVMEPLAAASATDYWGYMAVSWAAWLALDAALVTVVYRRTKGRLPEPVYTRTQRG